MRLSPATLGHLLASRPDLCRENDPAKLARAASGLLGAELVDELRRSTPREVAAARAEWQTKYAASNSGRIQGAMTGRLHHPTLLALPTTDRTEDRPTAAVLHAADQRTRPWDRPPGLATEYPGAMLQNIVTGDWSNRTDFFTNEPGLAGLVERLPHKGGAVVGVGGAMLDIGARLQADMVVVVDANPRIREAIRLFRTLLLVVDDKGDVEGWSAERRADEVRQRICAGTPHQDHGTAFDDLVTELAAVGLSQRELPALRRLLIQLANAFSFTRFDRDGDPIPTPVWCADEEAPTRIAHLTRLARTGRLLAFTHDLTDVAWVGHVNELMRELDLQASVFNLSNVLDYVPAGSHIAAAIGQMDWGPSRTVLTSHDGSDGTLGTFESPRALSPAELAQAVEDLSETAWTARGDRIWRAVTRLLVGSASAEPAPPTFEEFHARLETLEHQVFADPERRTRLKEAFIDQVYGVGILPWQEISCLQLAVPTSAADIASLLLEFEKQGWTDALKIEVMRRMLVECGVTPEVAVSLAPQATTAADFADLCHLSRELAAGAARQAPRGLR
jgi:hypothetical protein